LRLASHLYPLSLHDALPIYFECAWSLIQFAYTSLKIDGPEAAARAATLGRRVPYLLTRGSPHQALRAAVIRAKAAMAVWPRDARSEEHTSELQSRGHLVCRL